MDGNMIVNKYVWELCCKLRASICQHEHKFNVIFHFCYQFYLYILYLYLTIYLIYFITIHIFYVLCVHVNLIMRILNKFFFILFLCCHRLWVDRRVKRASMFNLLDVISWVRFVLRSIFCWVSTMSIIYELVKILK